MTFPTAKPTGGGSFEPQTEALVRMWGKASELERSYLGSMHVHYEREIIRTQAEGAAPHNIAHTLHTMIDDETARLRKTNNGRKIRCDKGCAACCRLHVSMTRAEAALIMVHCENEGIPIDWARLERQREHSLATWHEQGAADRRCAFLGADNACTIYEHRPQTCRKYFVMSSPKLCDTVKHPGGQVLIVASPEAEVIASATLARMAWGSMSKMLIAERDKA